MSYDQTNLLFIAEENTAILGENCKLPEFLERFLPRTFVSVS